MIAPWSVSGGVVYCFQVAELESLLESFDRLSMEAGVEVVTALLMQLRALDKPVAAQPAPSLLVEAEDPKAPERWKTLMLDAVGACATASLVLLLSSVVKTGYGYVVSGG